MPSATMRRSRARASATIERTNASALSRTPSSATKLRSTLSTLIGSLCRYDSEE